MATHTTLCLFDLPGLDGLAEACRQFKVRLTAHGGLVRRLVSRLPAHGPYQSLSFDLFDLAPFASDIDLIHSGPDQLTGRIQNAIYEHVPNAECFRWELRSAASRRPFEAALRHNNFIPASLMRLSTLPGSGIWDPWDGWGDVKTGSYRYIRNGFYKESPLYKGGKDLEVFSALLYLQAVLEAGLSIDRLKEQPGMEVAKAVIADAVKDRAGMIALQESAYLRGRLLYLFKSLVAVARSGAALDAALGQVDFGMLQHALDQHVSTLAAALKSVYSPLPKTLVTSGRLGGDLFRLPHTTGSWSSDKAYDWLDEALAVSVQLKGTGAHSALGDEQTLLLASSLIAVNEGSTPSARVGPVFPSSPSATPATPDEPDPLPPATDGPVHEFVHFAVGLSNEEWQTLRGFSDPSITAVLALHAAPADQPAGPVVSRGCALFPVPCVCQLRPRDGSGQDAQTLFLRCNCLRILEDAELLCGRLLGTPSKPYLQLFVIGLTMPSEE